MRLFQEIASIVTRFHNNLVTEKDLVTHFGANECNKWTISSADRITEFLFTWREKRADIVPEPFLQEEDLDTCWAIALFRGQSALVTLKRSDRVLLTLAMLLSGVDSQSESHGIDRLEDLIPFMEGKYVRRMIVHHRPRGVDQVEQDEFERLIENLLVKGPVVVAFDVFPSYEGKFVPALGQGIFSPTDEECQLRLCKRLTRHCVVLYGKGVEVDGSRIKEFWEALESRDKTFGDEGFVRLARGKCLLREVVELKV